VQIINCNEYFIDIRCGVTVTMCLMVRTDDLKFLVSFSLLSVRHVFTLSVL